MASTVKKASRKATFGKRRGTESLGDKTAKLLNECDTVGKMIEVASKNGVEKAERVIGKPLGIARMILGNMMRAAARRKS